jgi:glycosyltransferase involved in cell wall biosynthesis
MADPTSIAVVIPVYSGTQTLRVVVEEILAMREGTTVGGRPYVVEEVILVWDQGLDDSPIVMSELEREHRHVRSVWLLKNFGQHAATLAGIASSGSSWVVTMDEDGQHDPSYVPAMLDCAFSQQCRLVYFSPTNRAPHGWVRNAGSRLAKWLFRSLPVSFDGQWCPEL